MCRNAFLRDLMHFLRPYLYFKRLATVSNHRRMKRTVEIVAGNCDPVPESLGNRCPDIVDDAKCEITIFFLVRSDDPGRYQVVDLLDHQFSFFELFPERIETF